MPRLTRIPNAGPTQVAPSALVDPNAGQASSEAMYRLGGAIRSLGETVSTHTLARADHVNQGELAAEESMRMDVQAQIEEWVAENPNDVRGAALARQRIISEYKAAREERLKDSAPIVKERDQMLFDNWEKQTGSAFRLEQTKRLVRKANAQIEGNAQMKLRQGDHDGFLEEMKKMDLTEEQLQVRIRRGLEDGLYSMGEIQLSSLNRVEDVQAYIGWLNERDDSGNYTNLEFEGEGGISIGGRKQLERLANAKINRIQVDQGRNEFTLNREIEKGEASLYDIEQAELNESISPAFAEAARKQIELKSLAETTGTIDAFGEETVVALIRDQMNFGWAQFATGGNLEPTKKLTEDVLGQIVNSGLSKETTNILMKEWLGMKAADLMDHKEQRPGFMNDRKISETEKEIRTDLITRYHGLVNEMGALSVGRMAQINEQRIQEYFDSFPDGKEPTPMEARQFLKDKIVNPMLLESMAEKRQSSGVTELFE